MIKRAETLTSLDKLNLSNRTRSFIERQNMTPDELILTGRKAAIHFAAHPNLVKKGPKWEQELVSALDKTGFIRNDLYPRTWRVWELYSAILANEDYPGFVKCNDFNNKDYEKLTPVSEEDFLKIEELLSSLGPAESRVIKLRFGLCTNKPYSLEEIGKEFNVTHERIRQLEFKALRKLRYESRLCDLPPLFGFLPPENDTYLPVYSAEGIMNPKAHIKELGLSVRTYYCLTRVGIHSVTDILNYPKENWPKIRNLGHKSTEEVVEKIHAAGYPEFSVTLS